MSVEKWKKIEGYEGYYISNKGRVRVLDRIGARGEYIPGCIRKENISQGGYSYVALSKGGILKNFRVSRLVANAFIPNPYGLPEVNHKDENKLNNSVENLEWCTRQYNANYGTARERALLAIRAAVENGTWKSKRSRAVICIDTGEVFESASKAAKKFGVDRHTISYCIRKQNGVWRGMHWAYLDTACE